MDFNSNYGFYSSSLYGSLYDSSFPIEEEAGPTSESSSSKTELHANFGTDLEGNFFPFSYDQSPFFDLNCGLEDGRHLEMREKEKDFFKSAAVPPDTAPVLSEPKETEVSSTESSSTSLKTRKRKRSEETFEQTEKKRLRAEQNRVSAQLSRAKNRKRLEELNLLESRVGALGGKLEALVCRYQQLHPNSTLFVMETEEQGDILARIEKVVELFAMEADSKL